ncbi:sodium- and chloride-dependent GABA transporter ine-like isoform X2 [Dermacentor albipictus]|uniref:sodium- and chloride-dependent GABA transporter ine-like isoform X2 n=1 Tax=Dermacentor albipictus TaxID=60249 RepID=UPI0038FCB5E6
MQTKRLQGLPLVPSARPERRLWGSELQLTLSCASIGIGLVSAWRLPALLYDNGGGSFLLAYTMLLLLLGYPLLYLELLLGHYARLGPGALTRCLPIAKGVEVSIALVCACAAASMGSVMAQAVLHLLLAFSELPPRWAGCQGFWEKKPLETCFHPGSRRLCAPGQATKHCVNVTESVNEHFFHTSLGMVTGSDQQAGVRPELVCCLAAAWALAWAALRRRSPSSALVLPIAMVALLAVGTAWLTGASRGLMYLFMPRLADIVKPALWARAAEQVLLVLGLAHGPALANGSYCRELHDVHKTVTMVLALTVGAGLLYAIIVFSSLGSLSWELGAPVERALHSGQGAMFIALNSYSVHWAYSGVFFLLVLVVGANSQAALVESALTHWMDTFPGLSAQRPALAMAHCAAGFVAGLPLVSRQAGLQLLHLLDAQVLGPLLAYTALCEVIAVTWFYGLEHFRLDVLLMHGESWSPTLEALWTWFLPALLSGALAGGLLSGGCGGAEAPPGLPEACVVAWVLIALGALQVPLWAARAATSVRRSATSRCLVPSSVMELHQLSALDPEPVVAQPHP